MDTQIERKIEQYLELIQKVVHVEHHRIPNHMVEQDELISIGIIALQALFGGKTEEQIQKYNDSYIATAVRWAIRNELRCRYKWYSLKRPKKDKEEDSDKSKDGKKSNVSPDKVREAIYETILSIDGISEKSSDTDNPFDFLKDGDALPDERLEVSELSKLIRKAISTLPTKDRTVMEYRFYRNLQVKQIAEQIGLSPSRVTRIVQASLNYVREFLREQGHM